MSDQSGIVQVNTTSAQMSNCYFMLWHCIHAYTHMHSNWFHWLDSHGGGGGGDSSQENEAGGVEIRRFADPLLIYASFIHRWYIVYHFSLHTYIVILCVHAVLLLKLYRSKPKIFRLKPSSKNCEQLKKKIEKYEDQLEVWIY